LCAAEEQVSYDCRTKLNHFAECHFAECLYTECRGVLSLSSMKPCGSVIKLLLSATVAAAKISYNVFLGKVFSRQANAYKLGRILPLSFGRLLALLRNVGTV